VNKILYVYVKGGAPLETAFPSIAAQGELHVLALSPMPEAGKDIWAPCCASITRHEGVLKPGDDVVDLIVKHATDLGVDAVLTLSEFAVLAVAYAAQRLGLAGAGPGIRAARDKRLMREAWERNGVPIPSFRRVDTETDLRNALAELTAPVLLKPAWGAGSVAQLVLTDAGQVPQAWAEIEQALERGGQVGMNELYEPNTDGDRLVEEMVSGTVDGWYPEPGYGDYLSVEGIVAHGTYHPLAITAKLPTVPPCIEVASTSPCVLPEPLQRKIEEVSRQAVDALGLDTCGTHTELKLLADGEVVVIETAARFGGLLTTRQLEVVFGLDPIGMLVRAQLGEPVEYPRRMLVEGGRAAASVAVVPADASGNPWQTSPLWHPERVDWTALLSPGSTIEAVPAFMLPSGTRVAPFDPSGGSRNWLGVFLVTAADAPTLLRDCRAVLDGMEDALA
jgi:biotin carboxylase